MARAKEQFLAERTCPGMPEDTLRWAVQKWLNRPRCNCSLDSGAPKEAAAMRPYVKLFWPLVINVISVKYLSYSCSHFFLIFFRKMNIRVYDGAHEHFRPLCTGE